MGDCKSPRCPRITSWCSARSCPKATLGGCCHFRWGICLMGSTKTRRVSLPRRSGIRRWRASAAWTNEQERIAWKHSRGIPEVPSPLYYDHKLFIVRDGGLLQCLEAASGAVLYQERLGVGGGYTASPIAADGRVYLPSHSGTIVVVDARAKELKVLARNVIGEKITATPALVENLLYVRTDRHLFA